MFLLALTSIPQPPTNMRMSDAQGFFTAFLAAPLLVLLVLSLRDQLHKREPMLLLFLIGGLITCIFEPMIDVLGMCYFPKQGQWTVFTLYDRPIPLFIPIVYAFYVGGLGYVSYRLFKRGMTGRQVFWLWGVLFLLTCFVETPGIITKVYTYYGEQPLNIWGLPLWWSVVNSFMPLAAGAFAFKFRPWLTGWKILGVIALVPMTDGLGYGGLAWPMFAALNSDLGYAATYPAAIVMTGLVAFALWLICKLVAESGHEPSSGCPESRGTSAAAR
jgi:hypothetical protein